MILQADKLLPYSASYPDRAIREAAAIFLGTFKVGVAVATAMKYLYEVFVPDLARQRVRLDTTRQFMPRIVGGAGCR